MIGLIEKRHAGNGWHVFRELANSTGGRAQRRADAVAVGLWPSNRWEIHGYEVKLSRGDLQRDLKDMTKSNAVGKYCDYWWLAVETDVNLDGLVIPKEWGILQPRGMILRTVRKAMKRKAVPISRGFSACMIRHATEKYVPLAQLQALREELYQAKHGMGADPTQRQAMAALDDLKHTHERLLATVRQFSEASGVDVLAAAPYRGRNLGEAFKVFSEIASDAAVASSHVRYLENVARHLHDSAGAVTSAYEGLRDALAIKERDEANPAAPQDSAPAKVADASHDPQTEERVSPP